VAPETLRSARTRTGARSPGRAAQPLGRLYGRAALPIEASMGRAVQRRTPSFYTHALSILQEPPIFQEPLFLQDTVFGGDRPVSVASAGTSACPAPRRPPYSLLCL
jgi:hypothetical protein